jgi:hypothetical protein
MFTGIFNTYMTKLNEIYSTMEDVYHESPSLYEEYYTVKAIYYKRKLKSFEHNSDLKESKAKLSNLVEQIKAFIDSTYTYFAKISLTRHCY